jgi:hypothetical protein
VDYLADQARGGAVPDMPRNVAIPFVMGSKNEYPPLAGPYGAMPGTRYDPVYTDFTPEGTKAAPEIRPGRSFSDPFLGIRPTDTLELDNPRARELIAAVAGRRTFVDPTLVVFRNMILLNDEAAYSGHPDNAVVPARLLRHWESYKARSNLRPETLAARRAEFGKYRQLSGILRRAGVPLLAGTDAPEPFVPPGFSMHQELELLVESGLSPAEALRCVTLHNASALGQADRLGTVERGKLADLVLLDANPLDSIAHTRAIAKVFRSGLVLDPGDLRKAVPKD